MGFKTMPARNIFVRLTLATLLFVLPAAPLFDRGRAGGVAVAASRQPVRAGHGHGDGACAQEVRLWKVDVVTVSRARAPSRGRRLQAALRTRALAARERGQARTIRRVEEGLSERRQVLRGGRGLASART